MDRYFYRRRGRNEQSEFKFHQQIPRTLPKTSKDDIDDIDEIPPAVRYQELRELTKLRYVLRRSRKANPTTFWRKFQRWYLYPFLEVFTTVFCFFLPEIYKERYRKLSYAVFEPETWPHMFTDPKARRRAAAAWKTYANGLVDEWNSSNVITALILSAAASFLAIPDINNTTRYSLMITLLSSLASLAHATYHATYWRSILDDRHYSMLQLRCYISCYRPINRFLLCQPMLNLLYAMASFSIALLSYLWPDNSQSNPWNPNATAKITISMFYGWQIGLIGVSYKWNRSAFFTTNELLVGEDGRFAKVLEDEEKRADDQIRDMEADMDFARHIPVVRKAQNALGFMPAMPLYSSPSSNPDRALSVSSLTLNKSNSNTDLSLREVDLGPVQWVTDSMGHTPDGATALGFENPQDPGQLYVARVFYEGRWRAGSAAEHISSSFPFQGKEVVIMINYDVLCGHRSYFAWLEVREGEIFDSAAPLPAGFEFLTCSAMPGKENIDPAPVYIAAADYNGGRQLGEVLHGASAASIPYDRKEALISPFFVLLVKKGVNFEVGDDAKMDTLAL